MIGRFHALSEDFFCYCSLRASESAGGSQVSKCGCAIVVRRHSCMKCRQVKRFLTVRVFVEAVCESSALEAQHTVFHQLEMLLADLAQSALQTPLR